MTSQLSVADNSIFPRWLQFAELSSDVRNMIIKCYEEGKNQSELARLFNIPRSTIKSVIKKFHEYGTVENRPGRGRKKCLQIEK